MSATDDALKVHLVGSVPLDNAQSVFQTVCGAVGPHLKRIPDGETGERRLWIGYIRESLMAHPMFEPDPDEPPLELRLWDGRLHRTVNQLRFKKDASPSEARFAIEYARMAIDSFKTFDEMQAKGVVPRGVKFQIAIPTPFAPAYNYVSKSSRDAFVEAFGTHLIGEVSRIAKALPNDRIAIQWDVLQEILVWDGYFKERPADYKQRIAAELVRMGDAVPRAIELGYHYCYGSPHDEHLLQPKDTTTMVEMSQLLLRGITRPVEFLHMPVPKDRTDDAYYRPLANLKLDAKTELYLGLVHSGDDAGNRQRLEVARKYAKVSGIASECGWGRGTPERIPTILDAHRALCG